MNRQRHLLTICALLLAVAFAFRFSLARLLPNDQPGDGKVYAQLARNVLEQHAYSHEFEPPYQPSLIRLPGYPLLLAGIYKVFGIGNNTAVRVFEAILDTLSCGLVALLAYYWEPDSEWRLTAAIAALALAAACPFSAIFVATILTETPTIFLSLALLLVTTGALTAATRRRAYLLWVIAGLVAGIAVTFRPDSGLFAAAVGLTMVLTTLFAPAATSEKRWSLLRSRLGQTFARGAVFTTAFCLVLVPWTIRNYRVFHLFQPLTPTHGEMPGEFVPHGYLAWLRTWVDDERFTQKLEWPLDEGRLKISDVPDWAFDSADEKAHVAALFDRYNNPPAQPTPTPDLSEQILALQPSGTPLPVAPGSPTPTPTPQASPPSGVANTKPTPSAGDNNQGESADSADNDDEQDQGDSQDEDSDQNEDQADATGGDEEVQMTPEIDAGFAQIANERIARAPFRYYAWVPLKRASSLWFDTHSHYYPFDGELLPLSDLDHTIQQQIWLPLFAGLTWIYTLLGVLGGWLMWRTRDFGSRRWVLLMVLLILPRLMFFSWLENPEPRYLVEVFPFLAVLGGLGCAALLKRWWQRRLRVY
jgi:hypothetical protein